MPFKLPLRTVIPQAFTPTTISAASALVPNVRKPSAPRSVSSQLGGTLLDPTLPRRQTHFAVSKRWASSGFLASPAGAALILARLFFVRFWVECTGIPPACPPRE